MRNLYLLLFLLVNCIASAANTNKYSNARANNPAIGITMFGWYNSPNELNFSISIKNLGDETLTNISVANNPNVSAFGDLLLMFGPIPSLSPGQEMTNLQAMKIGTQCLDYSQVIVSATTSGGGTISDFSSVYSYYSDEVTYSHFIFNGQIDSVQEAVYQDLNSNSVVDLGDVINYTYTITSTANINNVYIYDNNSNVSNQYFNLVAHVPYTVTAVHNLTTADLNSGYVYNQSHFSSNEICYDFPFADSTPCNNCPNPGYSNIVTPLSDLVPNVITGQVRYNSNADGCATGASFVNRRITTNNGIYDYSSYTDNYGAYKIFIPNSGNFTTSALVNLGANFTSTPTSVGITSSGADMNYYGTDFCISSSTNVSDLNVVLVNINQAIPGFEANYRIYYTNKGSTNLNGSVQLVYQNGKLTFANALPVQNSATSNSLTWDYSNLLPFESRYIDVNFNVLTPPTVNAGDILNFNLTATPTVGDATPIDNFFTLNQLVRSSYDPNDKTVLEGAYISQSQASDYLHYVTRFQNTGTYYATTVSVKEVLDPKLDWSTFQPIGSSHNARVDIKNGNELTYTFSNIHLNYESNNEPESHGWLVYKIKPINGFTIGDVASSRSDIYFDYNVPIVTNTVTTQISVLSTSNFLKNNFSVYPNPATNYITIENKESLDFEYEILDVNGKQLVKGTNADSRQVDVSSLQKGFYFISIKANQGKSVYKLIKE
ncbi:T9SS type A sorting domain-containing protein [Flavobacterium enshiense]|uniref:T9SS type A sorting domain-containing protein n=1 Tax=Flavobacterium enshiense TaxID=1341165 RepID=UPI00345C9C25